MCLLVPAWLPMITAIAQVENKVIFCFKLGKISGITTTTDYRKALGAWVEFELLPEPSVKEEWRIYWLAILMEPTVTEEVFKEIDECQVLLLLCLIDGATSVLLLNVLWYKVWVTVDGCYWLQVCPCEIQWWSVLFSLDQSSCSRRSFNSMLLILLIAFKVPWSGLRCFDCFKCKSFCLNHCHIETSSMFWEFKWTILI